MVKKAIGFRIDEDLRQWLENQAKPSEVINLALREYKKKEGPVVEGTPDKQALKLIGIMIKMHQVLDAQEFKKGMAGLTKMLPVEYRIKHNQTLEIDSINGDVDIY